VGIHPAGELMPEQEEKRPNWFIMTLTDEPFVSAACIGVAIWGLVTFLAYLPWGVWFP
jgi:hypothetical protein